VWGGVDYSFCNVFIPGKTAEEEVTLAVTKEKIVIFFKSC
jgi:hypothetical protein